MQLFCTIHLQERVLEMKELNWKKDIHKFTLFGERILLDVNTGSVHVLDQLTWDILEGESLEEERAVGRLAGKYSPEQIREGIEEINHLIDEGLLFSPEADPGQEIWAGEPVVKALCLNVAHDCNLRCRYCFASEGHFGGERTLMPPEVGRAAVDFLLRSSGPRKHCEIDFFGGEPLLNMETVKDTVAYGKEAGEKAGKQIKFTITTNAVLLDEATEQYLNEHNLSVVLSLDGRPHVHDGMRVTAGGKGSYSLVAPKIQRFVEGRQHKDYYVRGTYTRGNLAFAADVNHLAELGFQQISLEPVVGALEQPWALQEADLPVLFEQYEQLVQIYLARKRAGKPFSFFHFNIDLTNGPCVAKRLSGCGAGHQYLAVDPAGTLYPCHQFVGQEDYVVGDVYRGVVNRALQEKFQRSHIFNKPTCTNCWARYFCGGGCHANAVLFNKDLHEPYRIGCALEKKRLECALYLKVTEARERGEIT